MDGYSPPREEGWLRHQENFGEAHLSAAAGVVAHKPCFVESVPFVSAAAGPFGIEFSLSVYSRDLRRNPDASH
jgi:hypothetical protein